jgi:3-deoxy-D-manno-octulosonic-acid transferase
VQRRRPKPSIIERTQVFLGTKPPDAVVDDGNHEVLVVDVIGQLQKFYAACDIAFVGGSLIPHGGQNMLEPAAQGRAVVFGPHTTNFRTDVELLLRERAAVLVADANELGTVVASLCEDPLARQSLGERARSVIASNRGATVRTLDRLRSMLGAP